MTDNILKNFLKLILPNYFEKKRLKFLDAEIEEGAKIYSKCTIINQSGNKSNIRIRKDSHILGFIQVLKNSGTIEIGESCYIGEDTRIYSAANIHIGNNVQIAHNVNIFDNNMHSMNPHERKEEFITNLTKGAIKLHDLSEKAIHIDDNVWIGAYSIILKGVKIGKNSVIGAGSVVLSDIPESVMAAGNPAIVRKQLSI